MDFKNMLNRKISRVMLDTARDRITFKFQDGFERSFGVEGDCCSSSWIEHLEMPNDIAGATLLEVEDVGAGEIDSPDHECLQVYNTRFKTDRGEIVLEYRNSSNGYYGGYLVACD
jgi:hypothetical protein